MGHLSPGAIVLGRAEARGGRRNASDPAGHGVARPLDARWGRDTRGHGCVSVMQAVTVCIWAHSSQAGAKRSGRTRDDPVGHPASWGRATHQTQRRGLSSRRPPRAPARPKRQGHRTWREQRDPI